jgi:hypothetical protein
LSDFIGLFGYLGPGGSISHVGVENVNIKGKSWVGGLVGCNNYGTVTFSFANGPVSGVEMIGGLVGYNKSGMISSCFANGPVSGVDTIGGLLGSNHSGMITSCFANGSVSGSDVEIGGLVGINLGTIISSYSTGSVAGPGPYAAVGGLVGTNWDGIIIGTIIGSFWDMETSGLNVSGGGTGKITAEMKIRSTFENTGWDFSSIWSICEGTNYPRLQWQIPISDVNCPDGTGIEDLLYLIRYWLVSIPAEIGFADLNHDGKVDLADFAILSHEWLKDTAP